MNTRRQFALAALGAGGSVAASGREVSRGNMASPGTYDVTAHGATGAGTRLDTKAIQEAIDACSATGGGIVLFPAGTYLSGTIEIKAGVMLHLRKGAKLLGSLNIEDYPQRVPAIRSYTDAYTRRSLLYAENQEDIGIEGDGTIDGQGHAFAGSELVRPYLIRIIGCRHVTVRDITLQNSAMWMQHYLACEDVAIRGIQVRSVVNQNNDGIDIDSCKRVRVSDCDIATGDDAIVLKSTTARVCEDVAITNCVLSSRANAIKFGTESNGGFHNVTVSNCAVYETRDSGIAVECMDGGTLDGVVISNVTMTRVQNAIFVRLGDRGRPFQQGLPKAPLGRLRNVTITNIQASVESAVGCSVTSAPERPLENVTLSNINLEMPGGGTEGDAHRAIPEERDHYPEYGMLGVLPSYGFYCRHARGLVLDNLRLRTRQPDLRPAIVCDDVEDVTVRALSAAAQPGGEPVLALHDVRGALIQGCRAPQQTGAFLRVTGQSSLIALAGNDLANAGRAVDIDPKLDKTVVRTL